MSEKECISLAKHMIGMDNKKVYTRKRADEDITAFSDYCNGKWEDLRC